MMRSITIFTATLVAVVAGNPVSRPPTVTEAAHLHERNAAPSLTQSGVVPDCTSWTMVKNGDDCGKVALAANVPVASILAWNSGVGADCKRLALGFGVCIGAPARAAATATGGSAAPPAASSAAITTGGSAAPPAGSSAAAPAASSAAALSNTAVVPATSRAACGAPPVSTSAAPPPPPPPPPPPATTAKNECK